MRLERKLLLIIGLFIGITATVCATRILYEKSPEFEINTIPMSESHWRGSLMTYPQKVSSNDIVWTGKDFLEANMENHVFLTRTGLKNMVSQEELNTK